MGFEVNRIKLSIGPIAGKKCILISGRKFRTISKTNTGWRPRTNIDNRTKSIGAKIHEFTGTRAPAIIRPVNHMIDPGWAIPGSTQIPLHVGIIGKKLTLAIEGSVILIPETGGDDLPGFSFGINLSDMTKRCLRPLHEMLQGWQQLIFSPDFRNPGMSVIRWDFCLIANNHIQMFTVWCRNDGMRTMLARCISQIFQLHQLIEIIITIGVQDSINSATQRAAPGADHHIEAIKSIAKPLGMTYLWKLGQFRRQRFRVRTDNSSSRFGPDHGISDLLDTLWVNLFTQFRNGETVDTTMLIAYD